MNSLMFLRIHMYWRRRITFLYIWGWEAVMYSVYQVISRVRSEENPGLPGLGETLKAKDTKEGRKKLAFLPADAS